MRSMWKGSIAFGLVNVPVKMYAATEDHDVRFHQVHAADGGRISMVRTCTVDGEKVAYQDLAKAYEAADGRVVVMDDADFDSLPVPGKKEIDVLEFVPSEQVDPLLLDRSYYLEPEPAAVKPYVLLREALERTERTAITRVVLRTRSQLAALRVRGHVIVLQTMIWPDEVRRPDFDVLGSGAEVRPQELSMAASLIDSLSSDFDPAQFHDEYREALLQRIDAKLSGGDASVAPAERASTDVGEGLVVDLMAALRASVERTKGEQPREPEASAPAASTRRNPARPRAGDAAEAPAAAKATPRKRAAKKAPAAKEGAASTTGRRARSA